MKVMEYDSIHMYSHILVGARQSVLYQCMYVCAHVHICDVNVCKHVNVCVCVHSLYYIPDIHYFFCKHMHHFMQSTVAYEGEIPDLLL